MEPQKNDLITARGKPVPGILGRLHLLDPLGVWGRIGSNELALTWASDSWRQKYDDGCSPKRIAPQVKGRQSIRWKVWRAEV